jgi:shikimate kinase
MAPKVVLIGPPGAGKSTIGRRLAAQLGVQLLDTDAEITRRVGMSIPDYFAQHGESAFRAVEEDVVAEALAGHPGVVSLGGGAVLSERTRARLHGHLVVSLEISVAEGVRRTCGKDDRPLLGGNDPERTYREMMRRRRMLYRRAATIRMRTEGKSPAAVVDQLTVKIAAREVAARRRASTAAALKRMKWRG